MKFVKRPVVVEAVQWWGHNYFEGVHCESEYQNETIDDTRIVRLRPYVITIHGQRAYLDPGDWIITEPDGIHHYPCKPDIFDATYEPYANA